MVKENAEQLFALCIENKKCEDLEKRKIYRVLPDDEAGNEGYLRIVDESGEDYLYSKSVSVQADFAKLPADFINDGAGMPSR